MTVTILQGDCRDVLKTLPSASVHCIVTSPPYWGAQRDYSGTGDAQLGMEETPEAYVDSLVAAFDAARRVLRPDGVAWINIGDSYAASGKGGGGKLMLARAGKWAHRAALKGWRSPPPGYKQKDLVGVPWLLATRLRASGWYLRRDIVWDKGTATEPTRADRPSGSHELFFLLSRSVHYWFDQTVLPHGTVWRVSPAGFDGHSAAFPPNLISPCIAAGCPQGGTVLDPFFGSGTTGLVADRIGRHCIGIDLNPTFCDLARRRVADDAPLLTEVA